MSATEPLALKFRDSAVTTEMKRLHSHGLPMFAPDTSLYHAAYWAIYDALIAQTEGVSTGDIGKSNIEQYCQWMKTYAKLANIAWRIKWDPVNACGLRYYDGVKEGGSFVFEDERV